MPGRLLLLVILTTAALGCRDGSEAAQQAEVAAATPCPLSRCVPLAEAQSLLGFRPLEPTVLPNGFDLYSRRVEGFAIPLAFREQQAIALGVPLSAVPEKSAPSLSLEYHFMDSASVLAITIREDILDAPAVSLSPETPGCIEPVSLASGPAFYGVGVGGINRGPSPGSWLICAQRTPGDRQVHVVMMARGNVLVQIRAFHESNLTRQDVLRLADSLKPAS